MAKKSKKKVAAKAPTRSAKTKKAIAVKSVKAKKPAARKPPAGSGVFFWTSAMRPPAGWTIRPCWQLIAANRSGSRKFSMKP